MSAAAAADTGAPRSRRAGEEGGEGAASAAIAKRRCDGEPKLTAARIPTMIDFILMLLCLLGLEDFWIL
jgi:hypothetical protein